MIFEVGTVGVGRHGASDPGYVGIDRGIVVYPVLPQDLLMGLFAHGDLVLLGVEHELTPAGDGIDRTGLNQQQEHTAGQYVKMVAYADAIHSILKKSSSSPVSNLISSRMMIMNSSPSVNVVMVWETIMPLIFL